MEHSKEQGTPTTRDHKSATVVRQSGEDEPRNDGSYDGADESEHDEYNDADEPTKTLNKNIPQFDGNATFSSDSSTHSQYRIPVHTTNRNSKLANNIVLGPQNLHTIKRSNKFAQTLHLPKIFNINPHSVYNKKDQFVTFVDQMEFDLIFMSESWERLELTLEEIMRPLEDHTVISNVHQRGGRGEGLPL